MKKKHTLKRIERLKRQALENPGKRLEHLDEIAGLYLEIRYFKAATMVCKTIIRLSPLHLNGLLKLGKCFLGTGEHQAAARLYETLTSRLKQLPECWWGLWAARRGQGLVASAARALEQLLEHYPQDRKARRQIADDFEKAGNPLKAIEHLEKLYEMGVTELGTLAQRIAVLLLSCGEKSRALDYLRSAMASGCKAPETILLAAKTAFGLKNWREAADLAASRLENGVFSTEALSILARSRLEMGEIDSSIVSFERLLERLPDSIDHRLLLAEALFRAGDLVDAERELKRCLVRDPARPAVVLRLAEIALKRNKKQKAQELYERCLKLSPGAPLALLRLGIIKFEQHHYTAALGCFKRLLVAQPDNIKAQLYLGRCMRITGSFDRARNHLKRADSLDPTKADPMLELGLLEKELHRISLAREYFEEAIARQSHSPAGKRAAYELHHLGQNNERMKRAVGAESSSGSSRRPRWIKLC